CFAKDSAITIAGTVGMRTSAATFVDDFSVTNAGGPLTFSDTFSSGSSLNAPWTVQSGSYGVSGGLAVGQTSGVNLATLTGVNLTDADVQANVLLAAVGQHTGLVARYNEGDGSMYLADLERVAGGYVARIFVNTGSGFTQISATSAVLPFASTF